jgi:hypothetical protein
LRETRTPDIGGNATTAELTAQVQRQLAWQRYAEPVTEEAAAPYEWGV